MKKLYQFVINKEVEVEEPVLTTDKEGKEIKQLVKVKKEEPKTFFIAKPTRKQLEEGDLFYAATYSDCIKRGILPANLLQKRFLNDGGVLSEEQQKEYTKSYETIFEKQAAYRQLISKTDKSKEDDEAAKKLLDEIVDILSEIQKFENTTTSALYQNTAENLARNKTAIYWFLNLSYRIENEKEIPVFGNGSYEDRSKAYEELEQSEDQLISKMLEKLYLASSMWYFGKAQNTEDFDVLFKLYENNETIEAVKTINEQAGEVTAKT